MTNSMNDSRCATTKNSASSNRQYGYDLARAFAVIGMVIVNYKVAMGAENNGPAWLIWLVGLSDGRAAATAGGTVDGGPGIERSGHPRRGRGGPAGIEPRPV